jgi:hypothetical protein
MIRGYNLVPWGKTYITNRGGKTIVQRSLYIRVDIVGIFIYPKIMSTKGDWNEFVDRFKLLSISIQEVILQKLHGKTTIWSLQNYILYIDNA